MVEAGTVVRTMVGTMVHHGRGTMAGAGTTTGTRATTGAGAGTRHCGADAGADKRQCENEFVRVHCFTSCCVVHVERSVVLAELTPFPKNHIG